MEPTILIAIGSLILSFIALMLGRKDKAVDEAKENNLAVIQYQLKELKEDIGKLSDKFDKYDEELDNKIDKAIKLHEKIYHNGDKK